MVKRLFPILLWPLCLTATSSYGQENLFGPSPGISASGSGINVQNNFFAGTANITVPIYSQSINGMELGISLSYNTKGIKVDELSSSVGCGWNIMAGGSIQRIVKDVPDESSSGYNDNSKNGFWINTTSAKDNEPDEFAVNIPGRQFTFIIGGSGSMVTMPQSNVRVRRIYCQNYVPGDITVPANPYNATYDLAFEITDGQGNRFYFEKGDYELKTATGTSNKYASTNRWILTKITFYDGKQVVYNYNYDNVNIPYYKVQSTQELGYPTTVKITDYVKNLNGYMSSLSSVQFPGNLTVSFNYDAAARCDAPGLKALTEIAIRNNVTNTVIDNQLKFRLNYSYFLSLDYPNNGYNEVPYTSSCSSVNTNGQNLSVTSTQFRLKLNSIERVSTAGATEPYYSFTYDMDYTLPKRFAPNQDYYGYANNKTCFAIPDNQGTNHYLSIPKHRQDQAPIYFPEFGIDKTPEFNYTKAFILKKVKNDLGGESEFTYSQPYYIADAISSSYTTGTNADDGVILKQVTERDGYSSENEITTIFNYSNGQRFMPGGSFSFPSSVINGSQTLQYVNYFSSFLSAYGVNGSNHGYSNVEVIRKSKSSQQLSRTTYTFTNAINNPSAIGTNVLTPANTNNDNDFFKPYYEVPYTKKQYFRDWAMGLPLEVTEYDMNDRISEKKLYEYNITTSQNSSSFLKAVKKVPSEYNSSGGVNTEYKDTYYPISGVASMKKETTQSYSSDVDYVAADKNYEYDSKNNPKKTTTQNSAGEIIENINYYPYDFTSYSSTNVASLLQMNYDNALTPLYFETWKTSGGIKYLLDANGSSVDYFNGYVRYKSNYKSVFPPLSQTSSTFVAGPASFDMSAAIPGNSVNKFIKQSEVTKYDSYGHPLEIKDVRGQYKSNIYSARQDLLLATTTNAQYTDIAYTSFEGNYADKGVADEDKGNWDFASSRVTATQESAGIERLAGKMCYLISDYNSNYYIETSNLLQNSKRYVLSFWARAYSGSCTPVVVNGSANVTMQACGTLNNWTLYRAEFYAQAAKVVIKPCSGGAIYVDELRLYPYGSLMKSMTYEPIFGISSMCNESDRFSFYEYDDFGRLTLERDHDGNILRKLKVVQQGND